MKKKNFSIGVALVVFAIIAYFVASYENLPFDTIIRESIYDIREPMITVLLTGITYIANWQTITLLCLVALVYKKTRVSIGIPLTIAAILSSVLYKIVKIIFVRPRPDISLHLISQEGYSFASGHSMTGFVFYGLVIWLCWKEYNCESSDVTKGSVKLLKNKSTIYTITVVLSSLIFLIGFSRIYLGVHYPTDVFAGWCLGYVFLSIFTSTIFPRLKLQGKKM